MPLSAVIFDLDGTLIDTNALHIQAWQKTFGEHHYKVADDRIGVEIGKGGDQFVASILGQETEEKYGDSLRKGHTDHYLQLAKSTRLTVFPGAQKLLEAIQARGLKLALATSSKPDELEMTFESAGVDWSGLFDVITTAKDAERGKPAPDIVQAAVDQLKLSPTQCLMIGDTPYDAHTARDAGVISYGLTCGKMNDAQTLRAAGMRRVFDQPADLLAGLEKALHDAAPGSMLLTGDKVQWLMREALAAAKDGMNAGELPIGCVIARGDGSILARGWNQQNASQNKIAHGEIVAFNKIAGKIPLDAVDLILVSTLEPCVMCLGAAMEAAVDTVLFSHPAPSDQGTTRVHPPVSPDSKMPRILGKILLVESRELFRQFLNSPSANPMQSKYVRQLLGETGGGI
jgi:HAD superfamily hydrolase (TIGR01509 family)